MKQKTYNLQDINKVAQEIIKEVTSKIIIFNGEMGAGKTTLIKKIVELLGSNDHVSSPTFSLVNEYKNKEGSIFHFDLYRINDIEEAYQIGIEDYLYSGSWCLIEWPDKIIDLLPEEAAIIDIKVLFNEERVLIIN
ncbi:ATPase, YjeE family [Galbibacter orientalis DSM 19592]|uniref:tRNA threonylcarbamoyladenosine biosynthesis protein TsaE n=1 Tax=Galbibacter orientalis DSM 19592 TaxID=926559 RepID=I3C9D5_9FLAO|nr:tRNA (adenosine(37)-N6)-threonylcarbamoyltransferase complex ATPase subunit type 1 TsaE [Galbibacter orientalis]EIJ40228.1 ATPase, YjeE family [Galbibacter orientalis DSM 19592]